MFGHNKSQQAATTKLRPASERLREMIWDFRLPGLVKRVLPSILLRRMYEKREQVEKGLASRGWQAAKDKLASASMSIIVAIHDAPSVTKRCLSSLERYATKSEVILIDDGSRMTETKDLIRGFSGRNGWTAIRNAEARGHSAACEAGARLASRPYLCLLNSDTVATPWCWRTIEQAFDTDARIGVAGPSTSASGNQQTLALAEYCRFDWNESQIYAFAKRQMTARSRPVIVDLPWADGFAFFIRRSLWQELGGFDPNLPDYGNEIDLCKRATNLGHRIVWVRNSYIHHLRHQSYAETIGEHEITSRISAACQYISERTYRAECQ
ncbi:MAG: glycosyltransferase [Terriglobales bacterium]